MKQRKTVPQLHTGTQIITCHPLRKRGRIQRMDYWSEQYTSARLLVQQLVRRSQSGDYPVAYRERCQRLIGKALRRKNRMYAIAEAYDKGTLR